MFRRGRRIRAPRRAGRHRLSVRLPSRRGDGERCWHSEGDSYGGHWPHRKATGRPLVAGGRGRGSRVPALRCRRAQRRGPRQSPGGRGRPRRRHQLAVLRRRRGDGFLRRGDYQSGGRGPGGRGGPLRRTVNRGRRRTTGQRLPAGQGRARADHRVVGAALHDRARHAVPRVRKRHRRFDGRRGRHRRRRRARCAGAGCLDSADRGRRGGGVPG